MLEANLVEELRGVSRDLVRELGVVGERHPTVPCTVTEGHILLELEATGKLTVGDLAERLTLDKSTTSRALAQLASQRRVSEAADPRDQRRKLFRLTKIGERLTRRIHEHAEARVSEALRLLGPGEAHDILRASRRYARALRRARAMAGIGIRDVEARDNEALTDLISGTRSEFRGIIGNDALALEDQERDMYALYAQGGGAYLVIAHGNEVLGGGGFAALEGSEEGVCELQRMYFRPQFRGLGLGYRLLSECLERAGDAGYRACYAETMAGMERANRLYEKSGFRRLSAPLGDTGHTFTDAWFLLEFD